MAKIKFGMMMTDARGKLGGQVFSKNRSGAYIRTKVTPSNARTSRQTFIRQALATISANWSSLTQAERNSFDGAVNSFTDTNVFGDIQKPTGKTLYTKLNLNLVNSNQPQITTAPDKVELPKVNIAFVNNASTPLTLHMSGSTFGSTLVISATAPQTAGTSFYKGKFRQIGIEPGTTDTSFDISLFYTAKFGAPTAGMNIAVQVILVLPNGQASIPQAVVAQLN